MGLVYITSGKLELPELWTITLNAIEASVLALFLKSNPTLTGVLRITCQLSVTL